LACCRAYDQPETRFAARETWNGITIIRLPSFGLGKGSKWRRAADFAGLMVCYAARLLILPRFDVIVGMTSPPLISFLCAVTARLRGSRFAFWVMDLNPDEAVAAGWLNKRSVVTLALDGFLRYSLRSAAVVFVLDRFMRERVLMKGVVTDRVLVVPPWSHDDAVYYDESGRDRFRGAHNLADKFVVMYSGNHSPCHPLDTLLQAARELAHQPDICFCFVGGGSEFQKVKSLAESKGLGNVLCLPYQPLASLSSSLSAADLHAVVMGNDFTGIVHPCKIYNILSLGAPFLYIGPAESHVSDICEQIGDRSLAGMAEHGDAATVTGHILKLASGRSSKGRQAPSPVAQSFSKASLLPKMCESLTLSGRPGCTPAGGLSAERSSLRGALETDAE
jgi:hypothetical protein